MGVPHIAPRPRLHPAPMHRGWWGRPYLAPYVAGLAQLTLPGAVLAASEW